MPTPAEIISNNIEGPTVFKEIYKLNPDYVPDVLPHRDEKISELTVTFRDVIIDPGRSSIRAVVVGRTGTGKTVTTRLFGSKFAELARSKRGLKVEYVHINCHRQRTLYLLTIELGNQLKLSVPSRGLSSQEVFSTIHDYLDRRNMHLIVTLDEFDYFVNTSSQEDIYFLVRLYDELATSIKRISYIFIVRDISTILSLDKAIRDHILRNIIEFQP
ncbi:ORC1-type DNA replication protein, partial [Acidianus sp. RZ1]